jgi:hypothetical protein
VLTVKPGQVLLTRYHPINVSNTESFAFHLGAGADTLLLNGGVTVRTGSADAISDGTAVIINSGTLDLGDQDETVDAVLLRNGNVVNGTLRASPFASQTGAIGASLVGSGKLTKGRGDTLVLSGTNTYTGGTEVTAGTHTY